MAAITRSDLSTREQHWSSFYTDADIPDYPSQFAVFACDYLSHDHLVMEIGCGSGRDSLFFARHGFDVVAFDASEDAIARCRASVAAHRIANAAFHHAALAPEAGDESLAPIAAAARSRRHGPLLLYARFFLHAITTGEEDAFLRLAKLTLAQDDICAVEFRTVSDRFLAKETPPHYRRYIDPEAFAEKLRGQGFDIRYFVQGLGYANYKADNAHVARFVFAPRGAAE